MRYIQRVCGTCIASRRETGGEEKSVKGERDRERELKDKMRKKGRSVHERVRKVKGEGREGGK